MNRLLACLVLWVGSMMVSGTQGNEQKGINTNQVLLFVLEMKELADVVDHVGQDSWAEIEYRAAPEGGAIFYEPGERIWWIQDRALLILGGTGMPLPRDVIRRASVWIDVAIDGTYLVEGPFELFPRRDGVVVSSDQRDLKAALGTRVSGIDAPYLSQVANYLAQNSPTLEVRGDSLNIDQGGFFGTDLIVVGNHEAGSVTCADFALTNAPSAGKVLTSDGLGTGTWQDPPTGLSLPYADTFGGTGKAFSLTATGGAGEGAYFEINNASNANAALEAKTNGTGAGLTASHSGPSGHAGLFTASGAGNINACLKAKHDGPGSSLFAEKTAGQGSAAEFVSINLSNGNPVVQATALTSAWVFNGEHYGQSDGAAKFHVDENNNHSPCVQITTNGFGAGVDAKNQGWGSAGKFHNSDAMNSDPVVDIDNVGSAAALSAESTGLGGVASFSLDSTGGSSATVVDVTNNGNGTSINAKTTGWGTCGYFEIDNTNSNGFALEAVTKGPGIAVAGRCDGEGSAASFSLNNTNSAIPAVSISNSGLGTGLDVAHIGTTGNAVLATLDPTNIDATLKAVAGGGDAGYFEGDVSVTGDLTVTGTLAKGSGSFKIDHPLDPQNKYLYHSFVESPDMMNVYNGNVRLDEHGQAWVQLPDYFEALNRDFRYQLTAIGQSAPGLFIAVEIQDLQFQIAGGTPFQKVSWQVTGIRQDPYARDFPIFPEVDKAPEERGKYLYPQGYDADRSAQISDR